MLASFIFALPLLVENEESEAFEKITVIICYTFALQGFIHLAGFLFTPIGDFLYDIKPETFKAFIENPEYNIDRFRGYALTGSIFFELPAAYGVACILFFRLQLIEDQTYLTGVKAYIVFFLLVAGITLSGRTGFTGLAIGMFLYSIYSFNKFYAWGKNLWKIGIAVALSFGFFYLVITPNQRNAILNEVFPYAFEAYYNLRDRGTFSTESTDALMEGHYFQLRNETLVSGHGNISTHVIFYKHTDAGYMNALIFGGFFYLLALIIYQYLYFAAPLYNVRRRETIEERQDFLCFLLLFAYMFVLEYKADAMGTQHITEVLYIAAGSSFMIRHYYRQVHGE
jgi:hypothetical protein